MSTFEPDQARALDGALADLLDLALLARHARWNVIGPRFRAVQSILDEVTEAARTSVDRVAERAGILGRPPDGRAGTVAQLSSLPTIEPGTQLDRHVVVAFVTILDALTNRLNAALEAFENDLVTVDLFTGVLAAVERYAWMLRAQQAE